MSEYPLPPDPAEQRRQYESAVANLQQLDFTSDVAVLDWLCEYERACWSSVVSSEVCKRVATIFSAHDYHAGVNVGAAHKPDDRENVARYIIGQAMYFLLRGSSIPQVLHDFVERWKQKFLQPAAAQ